MANKLMFWVVSVILLISVIAGCISVIATAGFTAFLLMLIAGIVGVYVIYWLSGARGKAKKQQKEIEELKANGFAETHSLMGNISLLFDHDKKKIAILFKDGVTVHPYDYIVDFDLHWKTVNGENQNYVVHLKVKDADRPVLRISPLGNLGYVHNQTAAENFTSKLNLLLSNQV